jgi:type IV pilus assembly protein PilX
MSTGNPQMRCRQRGIALITSMLLLLVVTIMAVSMFRSFGTQEKIAGNVREKQRALNAAISAQQYAELWLSSGTAPASGVCNGLVNSNVGQVCTNAPADFTVWPWTIGGANVGVTFTQFTANQINNVANIVNSATPTAGTYFAAPVFYVWDLGASGASELYQIDAVGWGGTANAVAVVESTYLVTPN